MLKEEDLVVPDPLTDKDWISSAGIPQAAAALLVELKPRLVKLSNGHAGGAIFVGRGQRYRSIYCSIRSKRAEIVLGLAASWKDLVDHRRVEPESIHPPIEGSVIASFVRDLTPQTDLSTTAMEAVAAGGRNVVGISWKTCPIRATAAASILTAPAFLGQVEQAL